MAYTPVTLPTPTAEVSPQGGGTVTATATTSGSFNMPDTQSAFQNYKYTATPNPGYRFLRFDVYVTEYSQFAQAYYRDGQTPTAKAGTASGGSYEYATNVSANDNPPTDATAEAGSAWWWYTPYPGIPSIWSDDEITNIRVVAVFEKRDSGLLVYSPNQNGQLVYSAAQGGALCYDG